MYNHCFMYMSRCAGLSDCQSVSTVVIKVENTTEWSRKKLHKD